MYVGSAIDYCNKMEIVSEKWEGWKVLSLVLGNLDAKKTFFVWTCGSFIIKMFIKCCFKRCHDESLQRFVLNLKLRFLARICCKILYCSHIGNMSHTPYINVPILLVYIINLFKEPPFLSLCHPSFNS